MTEELIYTCEQCEEIIPVAGGFLTGHDVGDVLFCESCFEDVQYDLGDKGLALAIHLGINPFDLTRSKYYSSSYEVCGRKTKAGSPPAHYVDNVKFLRTALEIVGIDVKTRDELLALDDRRDSNVVYHAIVKAFKENPVTAEMMAEGVHHLVNTLYHVCGYEAAQGGHYITLLDDYETAFNGDAPPDRRTDSWTNSGEYLVYTDKEADVAWDDDLENYIDDHVICEPPEHARNYFDREKWKRDARTDGRGYSLSGYDGNEDEQEYGDEVYYIYRTT